MYDIENNGYNYGKNLDLDDRSEQKGYWHKNDDSDEEDPRRPYK